MGAAAGAGNTGSSQSGLGTATGTVPPEMRSFFGSRLGSLGAGFLGGSQQPTQPQGDRFGNQGQFNSGDVTQYIRDNMGNYDVMQRRMGETGVSEADIGRAAGIPQSNVYSYMNRPDYKQYGPSGQFYQPIYRSQYNPFYQPSPMAYGGGYGPYGYGSAPFGGGYGGMPMMSSPFQVPSYMYATGGEIEQDTSDENETDDQGIAGLLNR